MEIAKYLADLMPQLSRRQMDEDLDRVIGQFEDDLIPTIHSADELFGKKPFKHPWNKRFDDVFKREAPKHRDGNYLHYMEKSIPDIMENLSSLGRLIDRSEEKITREMITVLNINILQLIEAADFIARYMSRLLNATLAREIAAYEGTTEDKEISKPLLVWLDKNRDIFIRAFHILATEHTAFSKRLKEVPDVVVNEKTVDQQVATLGNDRVDPLALGLVPVRFNPFYRIGMVIGEWQAQRLLATRAERDVINLRLIRLKQLQDQTSSKDPQYNRDIETLQSRLEKLDYRIKEMEEDYV